MPYTAIVNSYISAKPLFGNSINTTTQFMLNVSGVFASTPVSIDSEDIVIPTVEDPDPVVIPDDPTPSPDPGPSTLVQSLEGWSCDEDYFVQKNTVMATVSSNDSRLAYSDMYIGFCADGIEEWDEIIYDGEPNNYYDLPAGCYGDGIAAQVTFSNGVQGIVCMSKVPPRSIARVCTPAISEDSCIGPYPCPDLYTYDDDFDWDYFWINVLLMDTFRLGEAGGGLDWKLYEEYNTSCSYLHTVAGHTFYLYFAVYKANDDIDYPIIIDSELPSITVDFPFTIHDYEGYETEPVVDPYYDGSYYQYYYHTDGYALMRAIAEAASLTVEGNAVSEEGWYCDATYMVRKSGIIGTVTCSSEQSENYRTVFVRAIYETDYEQFEPNPYSSDYQGCYGDGIGAHVVFSNGVEGYVMLSKIPHTIAGHCMTWSNNVADTRYESQNGQYMTSYWYGNAFVSFSTDAPNSCYHILDYEEYQADQAGGSGDYFSFMNYLPSITVNGVKFYLHYVYFKTTNAMEFQPNVPTINLNFECYRCNDSGTQSDVGFYYHTNRQAIMEAIVNASGLTITN